MLKKMGGAIGVLGHTRLMTLFIDKIGGREINGQGLAMSWDAAVTEYFSNPTVDFKSNLTRKFLESAPECLPDIPLALAKDAVAFMEEMLTEERMETNRNLDLFQRV